jgi:ketosteroid isomerase-like protein
VKLVEGTQLANLAQLLLGSAPRPISDDPLPATIVSAPPQMRDTLTEATDERAALSMKSKTPAMGWNRLLGAMDWRIRAFAAAAIGALALWAYSVRPEAERVKGEAQINQLLKTYQIAIRARDAEAVANCYAPTVDDFYLWHHVPRREVSEQFRKNFATYTTVAKFAISNVAFLNVADQRATATFDREWDFGGHKAFAGNERERMIFARINGLWQIVSETELKVYWTRHDNPASDTSQK